MGGEEFSRPYVEQLEADIDELYASLIRQNEAKNVFAAAQTPAVLTAVILLLYFMSGVLGMVGLTSFANIVNLLMMAVIAALGTWLYTRYTGEHAELGSLVEDRKSVV